MFMFFVSMSWGILPINRVWAESSVSLGAQTGFLYGSGEEIVYRAKGDKFLSQLLWSMEPLFYAGGTAGVYPKEPENHWGLYSEFSFKGGIPTLWGEPVLAGVMEDRDWMAGENHDLSHYSRHDNYTTKALLLDYRFGVSFPLAGKAFLRLYAALSYTYFSWEAWNGYYQYAAWTGKTDADKKRIYEDWDESLEKVQVDGLLAVGYTQQWLILSPGLSITLPFFRFFSLEADFKISPLIYAAAEDSHWQREIRFNHSLMGGLFLEPRGALNFRPVPALELSLYVSYRFIQGSRGNYVKWDIPTETKMSYSLDSVGAGYSALDTGLSFKIWF